MNERAVLRTQIAGSMVQTSSDRESQIVGCIVRTIARTGRFSPADVIAEARMWPAFDKTGIDVSAEELRPIARAYSVAYEQAQVHG